MRPSKLTPEVQSAICKALRIGVPIKLMCDAVGISYACYYGWLQAGKRHDDQVYVDFLDATKKARAQFVKRNLHKIQSAARDPKTWTAAAWLLERLHPNHFARANTEKIAEMEAKIAELESLVAGAKK